MTSLPPCFISALPLRYNSRHSVFIPVVAQNSRAIRYTADKAVYRVSHGDVEQTFGRGASMSQAPSPSSSSSPNASAHSDEDQNQYVPLHVHSDFSLLDGASQLPSLVKRAQELGVPALALTDHGVLYGAVQLVRHCENTSVKPIIGNEMYLVNSELPPPEVDDQGSKKKIKRYHLVVLAKNTTGYRNLVKLTTMAHLEGRVGTGIFARPCINKEQLFKHREGLIVSSACLGGEIPQAIINDDIDAARSTAKWFRDVFGSDYYLEIQDHNSAEDRKVNPVIVQLGQELNIPVIATNDSHFTSCLDAEAHDAMVCIQTGKRLTDENRLRYAGNEYFKSVDEMRQCFIDHLPSEIVEQALQNTLSVAEKVERYDLFGSTRIPDFPTPVQFQHSHDDYLRQVSREGLESRLHSRLRSGLIRIPQSDSETPTAVVIKAYRHRLEEELDMICRMGFASYFLVVWDYIKHAREMDIPVGPGRGSAAGSLVAFALRITDVDPIEFNLLFERFLNPERQSMPDIDTDFSVEGRERVIAYVTERYGRDRVAQIITFNRLTSKAVLKDVARVHEVPYAEADRLAKMIPVVRGKPATLSQLLGDNSPSPDFRNTVHRNPEYSAWLDKARRIEGANKTYGIHAAGVVISATPLDDIVPLSRAKHGETITQYAMEDVEALGLLKMDFLGLKNLSVIETALRFINEGRLRVGLEEKLDFSVDHLPLDDSNTYRLLAEGELDGIFQLDASAGMRAIVREMQPSSLDDISSILALYRPGPLDAGLIPKFIRRKHGVEPIEYEHPLLEPILRETYGIMVYQEQIMRIARDLAGYSLGQADILRRAMGKKKMKDMEREKPKFVDGAIRNGVPRQTATNLFDQMVKFADYCFNKSHSTAYAYLTYQTAFLKANYPVEYCAALLRSNMNQSDKLVRYLADANASGVSVLPPSVNRSDLGFTVNWNEDGVEGAQRAVVLFGLEAVKTVGESVGSALIAERNTNGPFHSIVDLIERVDMRVLNKRAMGALVQAGAFDELHPNRKVLLKYLDEMLVLRRKLRDRRRRREAKGPLTPDAEEKLNQEELIAWEDVKFKLEIDSIEKDDFSDMERLRNEKSTLGFYASGHPLYELQHIAEVLNCTRVVHIVGENQGQDNEENQDNDSDQSVVADGTDVMILSCVTDLKHLTTAKGKKMGKWIIEDVSGRIPAIVFPEYYEIMQQLVEPAFDNVELETEPLEPELVVEEDARVVVWGKVDRESSGSVQIVVDDVQRVEDVLVVMATAEHSETQSDFTNLYVLEHKAAKMLEVQLGHSASLTFVDPSGIRRRRRRKSVPLSEKNRVPLILQSLGPDGRPVRYINAGHMVRFPRQCQEYLEPLQQDTGFRCRLLSVREDLLNKEVLQQSDYELQTLYSNKSTSNENTTTSGELVTSVEEKGESEVSLVNSTSTLQTFGHEIETPATPALASVGVGTADVSSSFLDNQIEMASETLKVMQVNEDQLFASMEMEKKQNIFPGLTDDDEEMPRDPNNIPQLTEGHIDDTQKNVFVDEDLNAAVLQYRQRMSRDPTMSRAFNKTHKVQNFLAHEAFRNEVSPEQLNRTRTSTAALAIPAQKRPSIYRHIDTKNNRNRMSTDANAEEPTNGKQHRSGYISLLRKPDKPPFKVDKDDEGMESNELSLSSALEIPTKEQTVQIELSENEQAEQNGANNRKIKCPELNGGEASGDETSVLSMSKSVLAEAFVHDESSDVKLESSTKRERANTETHSVTMNLPVMGIQSDVGGLTPLIKQPQFDLADPLLLHFDVAKLGGVLDAIAFVSASAASHHCGHGTRGQFFMVAMSGLSFDKLTEKEVTLEITANVAYFHGQDVHVLADVRETSATGKRKRVRSFGPVSIIMRSTKTLDSETPIVNLRTKIAQKRLDSFVQKLDKSFSAHDNQTVLTSSLSVTVDGTEETLDDSSSHKEGKRRRNSFVNVRRSDAGFSTSTNVTDTTPLADGGELLLFMSRTAEVCAKRIVGPSKTSWLTKMEWVCVDNSRDSGLESIARIQMNEVHMKAQLLGSSFDELKIAVLAEVVGFNEDCVEQAVTLVGEFAATCGDAKFMKKLRVIDDDQHLFDRNDVTRTVIDIARSISKR